LSAKHAASLKRFKKAGMRVTTDNVEAVTGADIAFFAVKPWIMEGVLKEVKAFLDYKSQFIVSIAPGISPDNLKEWLEKDGTLPAISYAIPNTAVEIGESMTFISPVTANEAQVLKLKDIFDRMGQSRIVPVCKMIAGTSVASCGIAYALRYISASCNGAGQLGIDNPEDVVCQTVKGATSLISMHSSKPESEIEKVTTPNGLTLKGLAAMEAGGFSESVKNGLMVNTGKKTRIVVKVGSNVLTRPDGSLDTTRVSSIVDQIVQVRNAGYEVILVTSGAVACGRSLIRENRKLDEVQQRQLYSSLGQVRLMDLYYTLFIDHGVKVGQILTTKNNFRGKKEYSNQRNCMETLLQSDVVPIVNENDTVSIQELMFTDNDELSGLVAGMMGAETLVLLSNVDGVYSGPQDKEEFKVIPLVKSREELDGCIEESKSSFGRGGMASKCQTALNVASEGIRVVIANGKKNDILTGVLLSPETTVHTEFIPHKK